MATLSIVINTLNEERNLPHAISSVRSIADEIVVVDMHSEDRTQAIAKEEGAKLFEHERTKYVEPARNFAISKATSDWILVLDADERVPITLSKKIKEILEKPQADFYRIPRKNIFFGKWLKHSRWWPDFNIRLFKKGSVLWSEIIHSVPETYGKGLDLEAKEDLAIVHNNYQTIEQYIDRMNRYTSLQSDQLRKDNYKFIWTDLIRKPFSEFLSRYLAGEGYRDGLHGLSASLLQSFSELVVYLKVWQSQKFEEQYVELSEVNREVKKSYREFAWWVVTKKDEKSPFPIRLLHRILSRF